MNRAGSDSLTGPMLGRYPNVCWATSRKTVFLLLLALARCVSDIHAIDPNRITKQGNNLILQPVPGFLPKMASAAEGQVMFQPIVVRSLSAVMPGPGSFGL